MKNKKTFKEAFGRNPWDPWSAKAGISESAALDKYLKSRGINPAYAPKDVKIAHSKSNAFKQWLMTQREQVEFMEQKDDSENSEIKVFNYYTRYFHMCAAATEIYEDIEDHVEPDSEDLVEGMAKLQDCIFFIEKHLMEKKGSPKEDDLGYLIVAQNIKDQIDRMVGMVSPDMRLAHGYLQGHIENIKDLLDYQNRKDELQIDPDDYEEEDEPKEMKESVLVDDPKGTITRVAEKNKEISRSARIIKSIYKKKGVMKEDLYDHEKDNKDPARVYGKSPKLERANKKENIGDNKATAAATLSGGTTLTKQNRDTVELDPMMRTRFGKDDKKKEEKKSNK
jgi:hypothetical protein